MYFSLLTHLSTGLVPEVVQNSHYGLYSMIFKGPINYLGNKVTLQSVHQFMKMKEQAKYAYIWFSNHSWKKKVKLAGIWFINH